MLSRQEDSSTSLVLAHIGLTTPLALVVPELAKRVAFPGVLVVRAVVFAQVTLLCFYFAFGRRQTIAARAIVVALAACYAAALLTIASRSSTLPTAWNSSSFVGFLYVALAPVPGTSLAVAALALERYELREATWAPTLATQFRSIHLILLTLFVAYLLAALQWYPALGALTHQEVAEFWTRNGTVNYVKSQLIYWSVYCGGFGYLCFRCCLSKRDALSEAITISIAATAVSLVAATAFAANAIEFWSEYVAGALGIVTIVTLTCGSIKRRGQQFVRRSRSVV